ncbi:equilibrative nucleobase transporter 1-like isoform X2 [Mya arenaria]|uniref:equilibrative nucleobase transporter 1-like isoform X2 n=1 Tax=Mya arenaria TaxID=6604 RepID=UPI0022E83D09|nr:equilibrative nucleobase transporter 1-like isoform X2 [Mya arenaria]
MIGDLYKRYPWVCTVWAFMEVVLFAGVLFGWGSLVFILKEEGFYLEECAAVLSTGTGDPVLNMDLTYNSSLVEMAEITSVNSTKGTYQIDMNNTDEGPIKHFIDMGCQAQESKLNLWFSIAVSIMYLSFTGIGYLIRLVGTRITRLIFFVIYLTGTMCLAFATPAIPWLIFPGLACIGTGGLTLLATNMQVADLHPHLRSTIVAIFTGFFDFSSINKQLIRIAFEGGIPRRSSYIFYALLYAVIVSISTWFFLPKKNMDEDHIENIKTYRESIRRKSHFQKGDIETFTPPTSNGLVHSEKDEVYQKEASAKLLTPEDLLNGNLKEKGLENVGLSNNAINAEIRDVRLAKEKKPGLASSICNFTFLMHLFWLHVHALRFVTFIGLLNVWLEKIFQENEHRVGEMLSTFSYMTMGAIGTALFCGFVYDYLRTKYAESSPTQITDRASQLMTAATSDVYIFPWCSLWCW